MAVVAAGEEDADQRLIRRRAGGNGVHLAELAQAAERAHGGERGFHEIASGFD